MTTSGRCRQCPVRPGLACLGEHHKPVCLDVENGLPGRAEQLVALAEGRPVPGAMPARPISDLEVRLAMAADLCSSGTGPCGCGPGPPRSCGREGRPSEVRRPDCHRCVSSEWWESGVEAGW